MKNTLSKFLSSYVIFAMLVMVASPLLTPTKALAIALPPPPTPGTNPSIGGACGLDIALVLDRSGSISAGELSTMKTSMKGFVDAFVPGTATQFSVTSFAGTASINQTFTTDGALVKTKIDAIAGNGSGTNWEAGLTSAFSTFDPRPMASHPNLIVLASDGEPNKPGDGNGFEQGALNAAITEANTIKTAGTRIVTIGIGLATNGADHLKAISSADAYYDASDFDDLEASLSELVADLCGGTINVHKVIDADGNLQTTDDQTNGGAGWTFTVAGTAGMMTDETGSVTKDVTSQDGPFSVTETGGTPGYEFDTAYCDGSSSNNGTLNGVTISGIAVGDSDVVNCTYINSPLPVEVELCTDETANNQGQPLPCTYPETNPEAQISASKIICDSEADLPNWGTGADDIDANTVSDFLASHEDTCHLANWTFEWADADTANPGDNIESGGDNWTAFASTVMVPAGSRLWVREQMQDGYIPFSGTTGEPQNDNSAEFYCSNDVLNYDNYDFIDPVVEGQTYYCVGFNVPTVQQCEDQPYENTYVSDDTTTVDSDPSVALSFIHSAWTAVISGATWIWSTDPVVLVPNADETETFTKTFEVTGTPTGATLEIAADNNYSVELNGNPLCSDNSGTNFGSTDTCAISAGDLLVGTNTLTFTVTNIDLPNETSEMNPAGLLYKLIVDGNNCVPPPPELCTDDSATNFNEPLPCEYPPQLCTDETANNQGQPLPCTYTMCQYDDSILASDPDCVPPVETCPEGQVMGEEGCFTPPTEQEDMCPNIPGNQDKIPNGQHLDENGDCQGNSGGGGGGHTGGSSGGTAPQGQVLGAETDALCAFNIDTYMRKGYKNNREQVKVLQWLLNKYVGSNLGQDGNFGPLTEKGVKAFQAKYADEILKGAWGISSPTGIFFRSTLAKAKNLECPQTPVPIPVGLNNNYNWSKSTDVVPTPAAH